MSALAGRWTALYGASPVHLLAHLIVAPLAAFAVLQLIDIRAAFNVLVWFVAAIILHDLVLLPAYSLLDRGARLATARPRVSAVNHVRVPVALSALMLVVFWGTISGAGAGTFNRVSGLTYEGYLGRWLLACALLFAASGALYLLRLFRGGGSKA